MGDVKLSGLERWQSLRISWAVWRLSLLAPVGESHHSAGHGTHRGPEPRCCQTKYNHRIIEHPKLTETHEDCWVQHPAPHRISQNSNPMSESTVQMFLGFWQLGDMTSALESLFQGLTTLQWRIFSKMTKDKLRKFTSVVWQSLCAGGCVTAITPFCSNDHMPVARGPVPVPWPRFLRCSLSVHPLRHL